MYSVTCLFAFLAVVFASSQHPVNPAGNPQNGSMGPGRISSAVNDGTTLGTVQLDDGSFHSRFDVVPTTDFTSTPTTDSSVNSGASNPYIFIVENARKALEEHFMSIIDEENGGEKILQAGAEQDIETPSASTAGNTALPIDGVATENYSAHTGDTAAERDNSERESDKIETGTDLEGTEGDIAVQTNIYARKTEVDAAKTEGDAAENSAETGNNVIDNDVNTFNTGSQTFRPGNEPLQKEIDAYQTEVEVAESDAMTVEREDSTEADMSVSLAADKATCMFITLLPSCLLTAARWYHFLDV